MNVAQELFFTLTHDAGVSALVGVNVFPIAIQTDGTFPQITYQRLSNPRERTQEHVSLINPRYRVTCWARDYDEMLNVASAVVAALDGRRYQATYNAGDDLEDREPEMGLYRAMIDFHVWASP